MSPILISALSMGLLALAFAMVLVLADRRLRVQEDPRVEAVLEALPSANCGACGFASCRDMAERMIKGDVEPGACPVGGMEAARRIAEILGAGEVEVVEKVAVVHCGATPDQKIRAAEYRGVRTCAAAGLLGGEYACRYGCLGYGDCVRVCPFGAITMADGHPVVDVDRCTGCGKCVQACPRGIITLEPYDRGKGEIIFVACNNPDKAPTVRKVCEVGCIGCRLCARTCDNGAFYMDGMLAKVDYGKVYECGNWDEVVEKCPRKIIRKVGRVQMQEAA